MSQWSGRPEDADAEPVRVARDLRLDSEHVA